MHLVLVAIPACIRPRQQPCPRWVHSGGCGAESAAAEGPQQDNIIRAALCSGAPWGATVQAFHAVLFVCLVPWYGWSEVRTGSAFGPPASRASVPSHRVPRVYHVSLAFFGMVLQVCWSHWGPQVVTWRSGGATQP